MAKKLIDVIQFNTGKYNFDFKLNGAITVICGDSSTGKTLFCNKLEYDAYLKGSKQYKCINFKDKDDVDEIISRCRGKVIVIDNADILIDSKLSKKIYRDRSNQYILMGHRVDRYNAGRKGIAIIMENNRNFTLRYIFMPKE